MSATWMSIARSIIVAILVSAGSSWSAPCQPGVDCYCDKVRKSGAPLYDSKLLLCEDFEAPTLVKDQGNGNTAPYFGPPYDHTGDSSSWCRFGASRGCNNYWVNTYGEGVGTQFGTGEPSSPSPGITCSTGSCSGKFWDRLNRWRANSYSPNIGFYSDVQDYTAEGAPKVQAPTHASGGGTGIFDGNAHLTFRMEPGKTNNIVGEARWPVATEIGLTQVVAYPVGSSDSGIWGTKLDNNHWASWKHNEWIAGNNGNCSFDGLFLFWNQSASWSLRPFVGFIGACVSGAYTGTISSVSVGSAASYGGGIGWNASGAYDQQTDWPEGSWGCVRGHIVTTGNSQRYRVWFQGPKMAAERLIVDFTYTTDGLDGKQGWMGLKWNAYANTNSGIGSYVASNALTFRYEDNVHIRAGLPVSCAQIGYSSATSAGRPAVPSVLKVQ